MKRKRLSTLITTAAAMLLLILDGRTAVDSARQGIDLCLRTVVPSLFPFFLLSILLTSSVLGSRIGFLRPVTALFRIPQGTESILLAGFLGGYPVGAQCISQAYRNRQLSRSDAQRMLAFCNNAGPAFLFGMIAGMFPQGWMAWLLWLIHILAAILTALILPGSTTGQVNPPRSEPPTLSSAMAASLSVMASVCGWVVLFRVMIGFLDRWVLWLLPVWAKVAAMGLLELSNGCCNLLLVDNIGLRFLLSSAMLAFGGVCVSMQTLSVTAGLKLRQYFAGKLLQTLHSLLLAAAAQFLLPVGDRFPYPIPVLMFTGCAAVIFMLLLQKTQKRDSIPAACGV